MSTLANEIGMVELAPPEKCCANCAFCERAIRSFDCHCILQTGIANYCIYNYYSAAHIGDETKHICDMFCTKHNANSFASIKTKQELEILEAAGAIGECFHPIVYKMFKNGLLTEHDSTIKQRNYAMVIAKKAAPLRGYFTKDGDFYGCPPLKIVSTEFPLAGKDYRYSFQIELSDDKMQLRHYIGLHDGWYRETYGTKLA